MKKTSSAALLALAAMTLAAAGCHSTGYSRVSDGARSVVAVEDIPDRCAEMEGDARKRSCEEARLEGKRFVSSLEALQQICLEGNPLGNGITSRCTVRAAVEDVNLRGVRVKIRESTPESGFKVMDDYWFTNDAMVDVYLYSLGFRKDSENQKKK